ncbi:sensor histidine kinase [Rhodanobacter glycinis]|uniref:sensor histidine kinase n=1 Tax=Rhodanobacter glycinis TaxID=582702 RepID=UPI001128285E|nr:histidine kinase [Rhodanobacter glycinis]TPG47681.1 sensor histidine kinase [Rhodanobacter glycinis]
MSHLREPSLPMTVARRLPSFWLTMLIGWAPIVLGTVVAAATVLGDPNQLAQHAMLLITCLLPSIPLCLVQRTLWRRRTSWRRCVAALLPLSFLLAFVSTAGIVGLATQLGSHVGALHGAFRWSFVFASMDIVWFVLIALCAVYMVIGYYISTQEERLRAMAAAGLARDAELRALRYQLQPHFLFNTLNAISTLVVERRTQDATRMIARLGDFLRATLEGDGGHEVALADELSLTEHYLDIEKARLGERLAIGLQVGPDTLRAAVPCLLLQPLVENAIRHGIAPRRDGGRLDIQVNRTAERLQIHLRNDGLIAAPTDSSSSPTGSAAIGLRNVRERLQHLYANDHAFELTLAGDGSCQVRIDLPFRRMSAAPIEPPAASA